MKADKVFLCMLVFSGLVLCAFPIGSAAQANDTISDPINDVFSMLEEDEILTIDESEFVDIDNIDVTEISYTVTDSQIRVDITVAGVIEDRGNLSELSPEGGEPDMTSFDMDSIVYRVIVETDVDAYYMSYSNGTVNVSDGYLTTYFSDSASFSKSGDTLTMTVDVDTSDETFENVTGVVEYYRIKIDLNDPIFTDPDADVDFDDLGFAYFQDIIPNPSLELYTAEADTTVAEVGQEVVFEGNVIPATGLPPYTYTWDFGDGSSGTGQNVTHSYSEAGTYTYELTISDANGDTDSWDDTIEIVGASGGDEEGGGMTTFIIIIAVVVIAGGAAIVFIMRR